MSTAPTKAPPRTARRLVEQTVDALRQRIVRGEFVDGTLPPQSELATQHGVSRSVIREAMQQLQSLRLIAISQGRSASVLPAGSHAMVDSLQVVMQRSQATLLHLAEVREPLEAEIAALAAERITEEGLLRLHIAIRRQAAAKTPAEQVEADIEFHRILAEATGNPIYTFLLDALAELLRASRRHTLAQSGVEVALHGHRAVLRAVTNRNPKAARAAMLAHVQASRRDLQSKPNVKAKRKAQAPS